MDFKFGDRIQILDGFYSNGGDWFVVGVTQCCIGPENHYNEYKLSSVEYQTFAPHIHIHENLLKLVSRGNKNVG